MVRNWTNKRFYGTIGNVGKTDGNAPPRFRAPMARLSVMRDRSIRIALSLAIGAPQLKGFANEIDPTKEAY
jgi:hypothetical protein